MTDGARRSPQPHRRRLPVAYCAWCDPTGGASAAPGAAWDTYGQVTRALLPALCSDPVDEAAVAAALGAVAIRILRYAPMWGEHGAMLKAAVQAAVRLFRAGDRTGLAALLRAMASRLHLLSTSTHTNPGDSGVQKSPDWKGYRHE